MARDSTPGESIRGFTIMRERAAAAGIELRIESEAGRGTRVVAEARREPA
jgi:signal transduction histidine kinase